MVYNLLEYTMKLNEIVYKRHKIRVFWKKGKDYLALFDPNESTLYISPHLSKKMLGKILFHELWHIICFFKKKNINKLGEENTALLSEEFAVILAANPKLKRLVYGCLK